MIETDIKKKLTRNWFKILQDMICFDIEEIENKKNKFIAHSWKRNKKKDQGGGEYKILKDGKIFDKVGVNFSEVYGKFPNEFKNKIPGANKNPNFWASGVSIVMHMKNPHLPAMHFNTRYIHTTFGWFGGGMDVTPCIEDKKYKKWFHKEIKSACDRHNKKYYAIYKKKCDEYFYLNHRKESRGIGGIFFDYKKDNWEKDFDFVRNLGLCFLDSAKEIILKKINSSWTKEQKNKQFYKRGRYVEFNLLYDRGTKFGLNSGGNIKSILMSLPPEVKWK